jgi:hypothetical protein
MNTTMRQRSIGRNDDSEAMYNSRRGSTVSESSTTSWGDCQFLSNRHETPRYDASDDDDEDMFSVFAWSACSTGKEQFSRGRFQFNETEREKHCRSITGRMDEVVALLAHQAAPVALAEHALADDGSSDDVVRGTHRGRRSSRRKSSKPNSSRSEERSKDALQRFSLWMPDLVRI